MRTALPWALAIALLAPQPATGAEPGAGRLRAGFGEAALPAPEGGPLAGYGGLRTRRADSTLDPPVARAVVVEQDSIRVAWIGIDLVIARPELSAGVREYAERRGVDAVLLAATHTHSGPGGYLEGWWAERITAGAHRPGAAEELAEAAQRALDRALDDLAPAQLGATRAHVDLAENRRFDDGQDETTLPVALLRFDDGRAPIVIATHPAHPIVLSPRSHAYSADYVGPARQALTEGGLRALLLSGTFGDQHPRSELGPLWPETLAEQRAQAEQIGRSFAARVGEVASDLRTPHSRIELGISETRWQLPDVELRRFCPLWWVGPFAGRFARSFLSSEARVQVLRAGPAWVLGVPAEPTSRVGDALRAELPDDAVPFVVAHSNDWTGYVVTQETYARGGYESCMSFHGPGFAASLVAETRAAVAALEGAP